MNIQCVGVVIDRVTLYPKKEKEFIEEIVNQIHQRLGVPLSDTLPLLIGRYRHIEEITSWLTDGSSSHTADILTVLGMGGIGKTSLAKYVFDLHSLTFHKSSFIEGINSRCSESYNGLLNVQKQLYGDISKKNKLLAHDPQVYTYKIEKALASVKVFLVLDDINSLDQLDALLGNKGFHPGSKIIVTTKDASLTERCALFKSRVKPKHTKLILEGLSEDASLDLLCCNAFACNNPKEGYEEVSKKVSKYCQGHPLALEVLGKTLYNLDVDEWEDYIERLKKVTDPFINKVLKMSFNSLPSDDDKELFKHIACFFVGKDRDYTETILKTCNINTRSGIRILVERCLLSIGRHNELMMHQLIQDMGRDEVRKESTHKPWERSRIWSHEESYKVLKQKKDMDNILGLTLDMRVLEKEKLGVSFELQTNVLSKMNNIMLLQLNYVEMKGSYKKFPEELRWLCLHGFPLKSMPNLDLPLDNLVALDMSYSNIESFGMCWSNPRQKVIGPRSKENTILRSLKILDLSFCEQLHKLGGFYKLPTLERFIVGNCKRLIEICESLAECVELVHIDLSYCVKLEKLPTAIGKLKKVKTLLLDGCNISSIIVEKLPSDLNHSVISLPTSLVRLSLANSNLTNESFPMDMSCLSSLKYLCLDKNPIVSMPNCVRSLRWLEELSMVNCQTLMSIEHPPCTLKRLMLRTYQPSAMSLITFDPEMSQIDVTINSFRAWSYEVQGMVKIQPLEGVEEKVLSSLGWTKLSDVLNKRQVVSYESCRGIEQSQIQMYYEFGIFSTFYGSDYAKMPDCNWIVNTPFRTSIPFTVPSSGNKQLRGLNFCYVQWRERDREHDQKFINAHGYPPLDQFFQLPLIEISNKTKKRTWRYQHCSGGIDVDGKWVIFLSHWMFGMNEMAPGDHILISILIRRDIAYKQGTLRCGMGLVYEDDQDGKMEEGEDALEYYKSWNHIIGGDLSSFQWRTFGDHFLSHHEFIRDQDPNFPLKLSAINAEKTVPFRAFSKMKSPKTLGKGKLAGNSDHQPPWGVQGVPPSQAHSPQGASTSKLHIWDDDDDDDYMMTENEEKERKKMKK
uniref:disease resistance protein RPV1-like n=1 Tax=Erigeron canadensis TaxID=72917 RepID=UPI001CB9061F|nr:disease resistance protein RPV1-like [Erigeron canadensis]